MLVDEESKIVIPETRLLISDVNKELIKYLANRPELLRDIRPRKFEQVIAEIFSDKGYKVELTPPTRDGGFDIYAAKNDTFGKLLYLVECKRYATTNKVGVEIVRSLNGVLNQHRATAGIIVTTSSFTARAVDFETPFQHQMSLKDFEDLKGWLKEYKV